MPKCSRYAASTSASAPSSRSVRAPPLVRIRVRPLIEIRPSPVSREQIVPRVKWESGEVCCHQQVGTKSARARSRGSIRYCGVPSLVTSTSPPGASASENRPPGSSWPALPS